MAEQQVTLQPGESQPVTFEAIPHEARTYQVSVNGLTGSFRAIGVAEFYMPAAMRKKMYPTIDPYTVCEVWVDVTNNGGAAGTQIVHIWDSVGNVDAYKTVTLQPGETKTIFHRTQWIDFSRISSYTVWAQGDWVDNNYSEAIF